MAPKQKQIAEALGVSVITVSRALRDHPDMADATRQRVLKKAAELGYKPPGPRNGRSTATERIGLLCFEELSQNSFARTPFDSGIRHQIFLGLQRECRQRQVETVIELASETEIPLAIRNRTVRSVCVFGRYSPEAAGWLRKLPALAVSSYAEDVGLSRVVADNFGGMRQVTEHLIAQGHHNILFLGRADQQTSLHQERSEGYLCAMHRAGLRPEIEFTGIEPRKHLRGILQKLKSFTAAVCSNDTMANVLADTNGGRFPRGCAIAGFDNSQAAQERGLTSYAPDWELMGEMTANLLISSAEKLVAREIVVTVPGRLMIRDSTRQRQP